MIISYVGPRFIGSYASIKSFLSSVTLSFQYFNVEPLAVQLWTLVVEVKFYFGVFLLLVCIPRIFKSSQLLSLFLLTWNLVLFLPKSSVYILGELTEILRLEGNAKYFILGATINLITNLSKKIVATVAFNSITGVSSLYLIFPEGITNFRDSVLLFSILVIAFSNRIHFSWRISKLFYWLGLSSYLIYLLHIHLGMSIFLQLQDRVSDNVFFLVSFTLLVVTVVSLVLALYVEKPMQKYLVIAVFPKLFSRLK